MSFRVGQKVVCVSKRGSAYSFKRGAPKGAVIPAIGDVLTIREILTLPLATILLFAEISNAHLGLVREPGFGANNFRPLVERKTDISIFHAILNGAPVKEVV